MAEPTRYLLQDALAACKEIIGRLESSCEPGYILAVGSLRRQRPTVHDIDIVVVPKFMMATQVASICCEMGGGKISGGELIKNFTYPDPVPHPALHKPLKIPVDIYFATPETWGTLVLIRTGSKENNQRLCSKAQELGMTLHADGSGLVDQEGVQVAGDEEGIYKALGLPYQKPEYR